MEIQLCTQWVWRETLDSAFLTTSQEMLTLLVLSPRTIRGVARPQLMATPLVSDPPLFLWIPGVVASPEWRDSCVGRAPIDTLVAEATSKQVCP